MKPAVGQCQAGSLTGAVASERVSEAPKGSLRMVGNHSKSAKAEGSLTVTPTGGAGTKVGLSDPVGKSGPKARPRGVADGQQVEIPVLLYIRTVGTQRESTGAERKAACKRGTGLVGKTASQREDVMRTEI